MNGHRRRPTHWLGAVGVTGLVVTSVAGGLNSSPAIIAMLAPFLAWAVRFLFKLVALSVFVIGLFVICYSYWKERQGAVTERVHRITGIGICSVLVLSLVFPLVVLDDLAAVLGAVLAELELGITPQMAFYASLTFFGALTLVWMIDVFRVRVTTRRKH